MKTCPATRQRPHDPLHVHCGLPPGHVGRHQARYVLPDGNVGYMYWGPKDVERT